MKTHLVISSSLDKDMMVLSISGPFAYCVNEECVNKHIGGGDKKKPGIYTKHKVLFCCN